MYLIKCNGSALKNVPAKSEMWGTCFIFIKVGFIALVYWFMFSELNLVSRSFAQRRAAGQYVLALPASGAVILVLTHLACTSTSPSKTKHTKNSF